MLAFVYDGSFNGLLASIYESYYSGLTPDEIVSIKQYKELLFNERHSVVTDTKKAEKVYISIKTKISTTALKNVMYSYLSDLPQRGTWIYQYLKLGWQVGPEVDLCLTDPRVANIHSTVHKVNIEKHRMLGFVRFKRTIDDIYYAQIEPDHNVVGLITPHFVKRFTDQNWMIHDIKRDIAAFYNQKDLIVSEILSKKHPAFSSEEHLWQSVWKDYFNNISITDRSNPRLQKNFMPARYWKHLTEFN